MKKYFYTILAAVAVVASCAKETFTESRPAGDGNAVFSGTILQPNGLTKVSVVDQNVDKNVYITWNQNDKIWIKNNSEAGDNWNHQTYVKDFYALDNAATTQFNGEVQNFLTEGATYSARYYGECDVWKNYVLGNGNDVTCTTDFNPASIENMPLSGEEKSPNSGDHFFNFTCQYAILQVNVPSKLEFDDLYVCTAIGSTPQNVTFKNGSLEDSSSYTLCLKNADLVKSSEKFQGKDKVTYFIPVPEATYNQITLVAANEGAEVARMATYEYASNTTNPASIGLAVHTIYYFDFCNTLTIETSNTSENPYTLVSNNGIDYKVNVAANINNDVYITTPVEGSKPANIYINLRGHKIDGTLYINGTASHVEGENGIIVNVEAQTSNSTFVVKSSLTIEGLTVKKGSVVVEGKEDNTANVKKVTIPTDVEGSVSIDVTGVSAEENDRVEIVNNSAPGNVFVVIEKDDRTEDGESKEYYITQKEVTPVEKDIVATIGKTGYETLAAAVEAVKSNETIVLVKDVELSDPIVTDKTFTLTLNANISPVSTWEGGGYKDGIIIIKRGGNLTINGSGKILNNGVEKAYAAVKMTQKDEPDGVAAKLTVDGSVTLEGYYYGIVGNGTRHNTEITVKGGIIKSSATTEGQGIFQPQEGVLTISGGEITGYESAVELRGGTINVSGGTLTSTANEFSCNPNGNGSTTVGAALAIAQHNTKKDFTVTITGGTFNGVKALNESNPQENDPAPQVTMSVSGGEFNGEISTADVKGFITGGVYSVDPWKYCAKGYASVPGENGMWKIVPAPKADVVRVHPDPDMTQKLPEPIETTLKDHLFYKSESQTSAGIPIPSVKDGRMLLADGYNNVVDVTNGLSSITSIGNLNGLDVCYIFAAKCGQGEDSDGTNGEFDDWNADFVVSLDKDVNKDEIGLWGYYSFYGALAFKTPEYIPAGTEIELLGWATNGGQSKWKYSDIKSIVNVFPCGAFKCSDNIEGATMKVDLRIFDPNDHSKYFVIESYEYTFTNETNAVISKEVNSQTELNDAIANAKAGDGISIATPGEYKLPASLPNITISGVEGVVFDCTGTGSIASIPNGATFKNVKIAFGQTSYHGFQHSGRIIMEGCTLEGLFFGYGDMVFNDCTFKQPNSEYLMWTYGSEYLEFNNCKFDVAGKALNVYQENSPKDHVIIINNCEFKSSTVNKPALAIKNNGNNGTGTTPIYYDITITNSTFEGFGQSDGDLMGFPTETPYVNAYGYNHADKPLKVTVDGVVRVNIPKN